MKKYKHGPNNYLEIDNETMAIEIHCKDEKFTCLIDKDDYPRLKGFKWCLTGISKTNSTRYARASLWNNGPSTGMTIFLHQLVMSFPEGMQVDHINRNGLDNRKKNLRIARQLDNARNKIYKRKAKSGYMGVDERGGNKNPWRAYIWHEGQTRTIGFFKTKEEAARAYDSKAISIRGSFAVINFPHAHR